MKKTLGGDRIGAGKKMEVELHNYGRSTHDLGYIWRSTMSAGTLVPFMSKVVLPGDTFDINLDVDVKTHPTVGPLFGSFKVQADVYLCPIRLYIGALHNNKLGIGLKMQNVKLPIVELIARNTFGETELPVDTDNSQINPSCIFSYLGIRGIGMNQTEENGGVVRQFNAIPWIAYWDIYKQYYANKQEEIGAVIHTTPANPYTGVTSINVNGSGLNQAPSITMRALTNGTVIDVVYTGTLVANQIFINTLNGSYQLDQIATLQVDNGAGAASFKYNWELYGEDAARNWQYPGQGQMPQGPIQVQTFPLSDIDAMREAILANAQTLTAFRVNDSAGAPGTALQPWAYAIETSATWDAMQQSQEGLGLKTYQSDLLNNWLQTEWIDGPDGINQLTAIDTSSGEFTLDALLIGRKVYDILNRIAVSGGTYDDWIDAVYTHDRLTRVESPMYMGGLSKELIFQEVVSNTESTAENQGTQPLGTLAGKGVMAKKHKGGSITVKVDEPAYLIGIISLTPRIDNSQGNNWDVLLNNMDQLHKPGMDEIGFQELITEKAAWWSTNYVGGQWVQVSAGKQPAWVDYMTSINEVRGNFAIESNEMFMTLNRRYRPVFEDDVVKIDDMTTYIDPAKFNNIFAQTSLDSQNFWTQIAVDITARRKMSAKVMPNL